MENLRTEIQKIHGDKMYKNRQIHSSQLYVGNNTVIVNPSETTESRSIVRHLSTVLLFQNNGFEEVQAAISHKYMKIYVSSNKAKRYLGSLLSTTLRELDVPDITDASLRIRRHTEKLKDDMDIFGDYELEHVHIPYSDGIHAEIKILSKISEFDYIGGTKRPCTVCFLRFQLEGIAPEKYNPHHGAYWNSKNAICSLLLYQGRINETFLDNNYYINEGLSERDYNKYDTDSEEEYLF